MGREYVKEVKGYGVGLHEVVMGEGWVCVDVGGHPGHLLAGIPSSACGCEFVQHHQHAHSFSLPMATKNGCGSLRILFANES